VRSISWSALALCAALVLPGCRKGESSPLYEEARDEFNALYARLLEDAYLSPELGPIEQKLEQVPPDAEEASRAQELLRKIRSGRERAQARIAAREEDMRRAAGASTDFEFTRGAEEPDAGPDAAVDGGSPQPIAGMPMSEVRARFGMCFESGTAIEVSGKGSLPSWNLRDLGVCRERHPGFDQKVLIAEGDKVLVVADRKDVEIVGGDAGVPPAQDAGAPSPDGRSDAGA
jgi:hypothetical protein